MKYPPPVHGPPVLRVVAALARELVFAEVRARLELLSEEPLGFVARAMGTRHAALKAAGRRWTDQDVSAFLELDLPVALEAAQRHKGAQR